jgi:hypothetical protein
VRALDRLSVFALIALFFAEASVVAVTAVDLPSWDEWELFEPDTPIGSGLSFEWLVGRSNEHRIPISKLIVWTLYWIDGASVVTRRMVAFAIFGIVVWLSYRMCRRWGAGLRPAVVAMACAIPLCPLGWEAHARSYPAEIPIFLLGVLGSAWWLFDPSQRRRSLLAGIGFAALSLGFGAGVAAILAIGAVYCRFKLLRSRRAAREGRAVEAALERRQLLAVGSALLVGVLLWLSPYPQEWAQLELLSLPPRAAPWTAVFWRHYLDLLAHGYGITMSSAMFGGACLLVAVAPLPRALLRSGGISGAPHAQATDEAAVLGLAAVLLGLLGALAAISFGRATLGVAQAKASHYFAIAALVVPFAFAAWDRIVLVSLPARLRTTALSLAVISLALAFATDWDIVGPYMKHAQRREPAVDCVKRYYRGEGDGRCSPSNPEADLAPFLDRALRLRVSFTRTLAVERPPG